MVSSTTLILAWRTSRGRLSRIAIIFVAWPSIRFEQVFRRRLPPINFTSTSAIADLELATSSLVLSELVKELAGEESSDGGMNVANMGL